MSDIPEDVMQAARELDKIPEFAGVKIRLVEPGTVVGYDKAGIPVTVEDDNPVIYARGMYCTPVAFSRLKLLIRDLSGKPAGRDALEQEGAR